MTKFLPVFFFILFLQGCDNREHQSTDIKYSSLVTKTNLPPYKLVSVNDHLITSKIFTLKKASLFPSFPRKKQNEYLNNLINDEIIIRFALDERNITNILDERKRVTVGFKILRELALSPVADKFTDKYLKDIYEKNKESYWHEKHYEASDIMLSSKFEAEEIIEKLEQSLDVNKTFVTLAKKYSLDKSSKVGGYLGHFELKMMPTAFSSALSKLKKFEYSKKPVKTTTGYHIILLHDIVAKGYIPFDLVKNNIIFLEKKEIIEKYALNKLEELKPNAKVVYFYDFNLTSK